MPTFPESGTLLSQEQAFNMLLGSIAMEELALSHILNAEGEKLQYVLGTLPGTAGTCPTTQELLEVNQSITRLLENVAHNQFLLKGKLTQVLDAKGSWEPPQKRVCHFRAGKCSPWQIGQRLPWQQDCGACFQGCSPGLLYPPEKGSCLLEYSFILGTQAEITIALHSLHRDKPLLCAHAQGATVPVLLSGSCTLDFPSFPVFFTLCSPGSVTVLRATATLTPLP